MVPDRAAPAAQFGGRPGPGGPANACATDIQSTALSPRTTSAVPAMLRLCVTTRQKSRAGSSTTPTGSPAPDSPICHRYDSPEGAHRVTSMRPGGGCRLRMR